MLQGVEPGVDGALDHLGNRTVDRDAASGCVHASGGLGECLVGVRACRAVRTERGVADDLGPLSAAGPKFLFGGIGQLVILDLASQPRKILPGRGEKPAGGQDRGSPSSGPSPAEL